MSDTDLQDLIHENMMRAFEQGEKAEQKRILKRMQSYFELTQFSEDYEGGESNSEWDRGYQAAMAIAKGEQK